MRSVLGTLVPRLRPLAAAAALSLAGLAGTAVQARAFDTPNPYASGPNEADVTIRKLTAFGDSFTRKKRRPFHNWAEQLLYEDGEVAALADFAVSGATGGTYAGYTNDFAHQVTKWLKTNIVWRARDITVVYLGYNDIDGGPGSDTSYLNDAIANYQSNLQQIISRGATGANTSPHGSFRHVLLVMPHNWARSPYYVNQPPEDRELMQTRTQILDGLLAQAARNTPNAIAVDMYDPMECVYGHPDLFGFTNVTDPAPALNDPDYLYDTGTSGLFHYGYQGQRLIKQVIQYYLTRGWDWANSTKDPASAKQLLLADLESGNVFPDIKCPAPSAAPAVVAARPQALHATVSLQALEADPARFGVAAARRQQAR